MINNDLASIKLACCTTLNGKWLPPEYEKFDT
jgi:hypothetical protein